MDMPAPNAPSHRRVMRFLPKIPAALPEIWADRWRKDVQCNINEAPLLAWEFLNTGVVG